MKTVLKVVPVVGVPSGQRRWRLKQTKTWCFGVFTLSEKTHDFLSQEEAVAAFEHLRAKVTHIHTYGANPE